MNLRLLQGDLDAVREWLEKGSRVPKPDEGTLEFHIYEHDQIMRARAMIALHRAQEAHAILQPVLRLLQGAGRKRRTTEVLGLMALAEQSLGQSQQAIQTLEQALLLARSEGFVRTILDLGEGIRELLVEAARRGGGRRLCQDAPGCCSDARSALTARGKASI